MTSKIHAYMSGALTNLADALTIPPCSHTNGDLRGRLEDLKANCDLQRFARMTAEGQKAHYERIGKEVCEPLGVELYLPHKHSDPEHDADLAPETVHILDRLQVTASSFVIACGDIPSLGVGQELEIASQAGIPVIAYKHIRTRTSRMFLGSPILCEDTLRGLSPQEDSEKVIEYETEQDLFPRLRKRIQFLLDYLDKCVMPSRSRDHFATFAERLDYFLEQNSHLNTRELAARMGVPGTFVASFLKSPERLREHFLAGMPATVDRLENIKATGYDFDRFTNPSLTVIRKLATALNLSVAELIGLSEGLTERDERVIQHLLNDHVQVTLTEFVAVRKRIPVGIAQRQLRQTIAEELQNLRGK